MSRPKIIVVVKWSFDFFEVESLVTIAFVTFIQSSKLNWLLQNLTKNWPAHTSSQWSKKPLCCMPFHQVNASVRSNGNTPNYYLSTLYAPRICNLGPSLLIFRFISIFLWCGYPWDIWPNRTMCLWTQQELACLVAQVLRFLIFP